MMPRNLLAKKLKILKKAYNQREFYLPEFWFFPFVSSSSDISFSFCFSNSSCSAFIFSKLSFSKNTLGGSSSAKLILMLLRSNFGYCPFTAPNRKNIISSKYIIHREVSFKIAYLINKPWR